MINQIFCITKKKSPIYQPSPKFLKFFFLSLFILLSYPIWAQDCNNDNDPPTAVCQNITLVLDNNTNGIPNEDDEAIVVVAPAQTPPAINKDIDLLEDGSLRMNKLYPSPAINQLFMNLESTDEKNQSFQIHDASGKVVLERSILLHEGGNKLELDVSTLITGLYYLVLPGLNGNSIQKKVVIMKE